MSSDTPRKPLPYYPFYVNDFDESHRVLAMNLAEVGLYLLALNESWKRGSIPDDPRRVAMLIRKDAREVQKAWAIVRACFIENGTPGRLVNVRQETERAKAVSKSLKATLAVRTRYESSTDVGSNEGSDEGSNALTPRVPRASESESKSFSEDLKKEKVASEKTRRAWFESEFWPIVWQKIGVGAARAAWLKKIEDIETKELAVKAAKAQTPAILARGRRPGATTLHPATWLNQERFRDEIETDLFEESSQNEGPYKDRFDKEGRQLNEDGYPMRILS
jgi:uncharacterized protein YdaU (DUF1376 family)